MPPVPSTPLSPPPRARLRWAALLAAVVATALACGGRGKPDEPAQDKPTILGASDVVTVGQDTIASGPRISGTLEPKEKAVIRAEVGGSVTAISAEIGQPVRKGDVLGRIESAAPASQYASANASVAAAEQQVQNARREVERTTTLVQAGALAQRDLESAQSAAKAAQAQLDGARAQLAGARQQLDATTIASPIDGIVSERSIGMGDVVAPGAPLFTVIDPTSLRLSGAVPAEAVGQLALDTPVHFTVQGTSQQLDGHIERIAPAVDPATRQIPVLVDIPNPGGSVVAGLFAEGRVATQVQQGMIVPSDAVDTSTGEPRVVTVTSGVATHVPVHTGIEDPDAETVQILDGIQPGDVVVVGAAKDIPDGTKVEIRKDGTAATGAGDGAEG